MEDTTPMETRCQMEETTPMDNTASMEEKMSIEGIVSKEEKVPKEQAGALEQKEEKKCCCCHKKKERSEKEYKDLIHRLNRIEGQIRGIRNMVEQDAYCPDILIQVAAANAALNSFNKVLLGNHLRTCVANDIREGHDETIDELLKVLQRLMK